MKKIITIICGFVLCATCSWGAVTIKLKGDTAANWTTANPTLSAREPGIETDTGRIKYGDGTNNWSALPYKTPVIVASGAYTVDAASIAPNTCASSVAVTASGVTTTDVIIATPNAILSAVAGFGVTAAGAVRIDIYPTSGNVNFQFCNPTAAAIDPGSVTINWKVLR